MYYDYILLIPVVDQGQIVLKINSIKFSQKTRLMYNIKS